MSVTNIVFFDSRVPELETLASSLNVDSAWFILDAEKDGIRQMHQVLASYADLNSIQVISHGAIGSLFLGNTVLTVNNIGNYERELADIGASLTDGGDILIYGCDVAQGELGQFFIRQLAAYTAADVAASEDLTGFNGNWILESETGTIEETTLIFNNYNETLLSFADTPGVNTYTGGAGSDTVIFSGQQSNYNLSKTISGALQVAGVTGTDTLLNIETLQFDDGRIDVTSSGPNAEVRVNTFTANDQLSPVVTALNDGGWLVTWQSYGQDGSGDGIYGQRFTANGACSGAEFQINTTISDGQIYPSATALSDGGWVVMWQSIESDGASYGIYGQAYTANGSKRGAEFRVNTTTANDQSNSSVTALADGGWVVTWQSNGQDGSSNGIYGQRYGIDGSMRGAEFKINTYTANDQSNPSVAALMDGGWLVTWQSYGQDGSSNGIYGQRYKADSSINGIEFKVNTYTTNEQFYPSLDVLADGGWVVTWTSYLQDGSSYGVYGQRYAASGVTVGAAFKVNTYAQDNQWFSSVTALADGGWVVTWESSQDGSGYGVYGQRYAANGALSGAEFRVNTFTRYTQSDSSVTALADGGWVVSWASYLQDGSGWGIYTQRYDSSGEPLKTGLDLRTIGDATDQLLNGLSGNDTLDGKAGADSMIGGAGNDTYYVDNEADLVIEQPSDGTDTIHSLVTYTLSDDVEILILDGSSNISGTGNSLNNILVGNSGANALMGRAGDDIYYVDNLGDIVTEQLGEGVDTVHSTVTYNLPANVETLVLEGSANISGDGNSLDNELTGNSGINTLVGGAGNDTYYVNNESDIVTERQGEGIDTVRSTVSYNLSANVENLILDGSTSINGIGNALDNVLTGNSANNSLYGGAGSDTAIFSGLQSSYSFSKTATGALLVVGPSGSDTLLSVETLQFSDSRVQIRNSAAWAEFKVNTSTTYNQLNSSAASLPDGGWIVVWHTYQDYLGISGIFAQRYSVNGTASGAEFKVNSNTTSYKLYPSVAVLSDGGWVITWTSWLQDGSSTGIYCQRYDAAGLKNGAEFKVNSYTANEQSSPSISSLTDGGWVVIWKSQNQDGSGYGIYGQRYSANGVSSGAEFKVNTFTTGDQHAPTVTGLNDGGWVVTWTSNGQDGFGDGIYGQRYSSEGGAYFYEFKVNTYTTNSQMNSAVTALADGGWVVTWESVGQDGFNTGVYAQIYNSNSTVRGSEFRVNTYTALEQSAPSVAALKDGGWVVIWDSHGQDGSDAGIYGQRYSATGLAIGSEFRVNTTTNGIQRNPAVAALADGGWIVTWEDSWGDGGNDYGIHAQRYDEQGQPLTIGLDLTITGDASDQSLNGSAGNDWINAGNGNDSLDGGSNDDTLVGGPGNDVYFVENSADVVVELLDEGTDVVRSTATSFTLTANVENLILDGSANIIGIGNTLNNGLTGNSGDNTLDGGAGEDVLVGGLGNDIYKVDNAGDEISELSNAGTDTVYSKAYHYTLSANIENLILDGNAAINGTGNSLDNVITGNSSDNTLIGLGGNDVLNGGSGRDTAVFTGVQSSYSIAQDASGTFRVVGLDGADALNGVEGLQFDDAQIQIVNSGPYPEFLVNTYTVGSQSNQSVASLGYGGWIVTWQSSEQDGSSFGIYAQRYASDGSQIGSEFQVNSYSADSQLAPCVAALTDGGWVVTWASNGQDSTSYSGVYGQRYSSDGAAVGAEFQVNTYTNNSQDAPSVVALTTGGWVIVWQSYDQDGSGEGIYGQLYSSDGSVQGAEFRVNSYTSSDQLSPSLAALPQGGWLATWQSSNQDGSGSGIYCQRYDVNGSANGPEFKVNKYTTNHQSTPSVTVLSDGGWVVTWQSYGQDGSNSGIYGQRYLANNSPIGSEFRVNTYVTNSQASPSIAALADGGWVVTWNSYAQDGSNQGIYSQRFMSDGTVLGAEFRVNTNTIDSQDAPTVIALADGGWLVTWQSNSQDGSSSGIYAQRYNAEGSKTGFDLTITGDGSDQLLLGGSGNDTVYGGEGADTLVGSYGNDTLDGGFGVDSLVGGGGDDTYLVDNVGDVVTEQSGEGTDAVLSSVSYTVSANVEMLKLQGSANINGTGNGIANVLIGNSSNNSLIGLAGDDTLDGVGGADHLSGGADNDTYLVDDVGDVVVEQSNEGTDSVRSSISYTLTANVENLTLVGDADLSGTGNAINNTLTGNSANNTLVGGAGDDFLNGGEGWDTAVFSGLRSAYSITKNAEGSLQVVGTDGVDTLSSIEVLQFDDTSVEIAKPIRSLEVKVNSTTKDDQSLPSVTALADGGWVEIWTSSGQDGYAGGLYGQRFTANGLPVGTEFMVNKNPVGDQSFASATALADGGWVVTWTSNGQDGYLGGIYGQRYAANGTTKGSEFKINTYFVTDQSYPSVTTLLDGGWVVCWQSYNQDTSGYGIYAQRFSLDGVAIGPESKVNTYITSDQSACAVAALADGGWLVTWQSNLQDGSGYGIYAQRYWYYGSARGSEFKINTTTASDQSSPCVAALHDGGWVVVWQSNLQDGSDYGIYSQRYAADGKALGAEWKVNTCSLGAQANPSVVALADRGWVVVWSSGGEDGSFDGIYGQRYSDEGLAVGLEFRVNATTSSDQSAPCITALPDGGWVVTWQSNGQDGSGYGIYAQRYDSLGLPATTGFEVCVTGNESNQRIMGFGGNDTLDGGFGVDSLVGGGGDDTYLVDNVGDVVTEQSGEGTDAVLSSVSYTVSANVEMLKLQGSANINGTGNGIANVLIGNSSNNSLIGLAGDDTLDGVGGADHLSGGADNDTYLVDDVGDVVVEQSNEGTDSVRSSISYTLTANVENLTLVGDADLSGTGNAINNTLTGNSANNTLVGGAGDDFLNGGEGWDTAVFSGLRSAYSITKNAEGSLQVVGTDGVDTLSSIEVLQFDDIRLKIKNTGPAAQCIVNTTESYISTYPSTVALSDGGWVVTWVSDDLENTGVFSQRFSASGVMEGSETEVNTYTRGAQYAPTIAPLVDGGWVVTWESDGQDGSWGAGIYGQRYAMDGTPSGAEFRANTYVDNFQSNPSVTALTDGGWLVTWTSYQDSLAYGDSTRYGIYGQRYDVNGVASGAEFRVNTTTFNDQRTPSVTALADGGWVVTWQSYGQDAVNGWGIYGQRYDTNGVLRGQEFKVNTSTNADQTSPSVTALADGGWVVTWQSYGQDGGGAWGIYGQRYDADGVMWDQEFLVNTYTSADQSNPSVTALADGGWVVTWQSYAQDVQSMWGIYGQRFSANGVANGTEFKVSYESGTNSSQEASCVTALSDGGWLVTWGEGGTVKSQRYDSSGEPLTTTFETNILSTGSVVITGSASQGQTLTATNTLSDPDGIGAITYTWYASGNVNPLGNGASYTLTQAEVGKSIIVKASYSDSFGTVENVSSAASGVVSNINDSPAGAVTVTGSASQGQTLTATNTLSDPDGIGAITYTWYASGNVNPLGNGASYTLTQAEVGKSIIVKASYSDSFGTVENVSSAASGVVSNINDSPAGAVTVTGSASQGQTLTATNTLSDPDGIGAITYTWYASGNVNPLGNGASYTLTQAEVGKSIIVKASYSDSFGTVENVSSAASGVVSNINDSPAGAVTVTGSASQGQTLTATNTLSDPDGIGAITYTWYASGNVNPLGNGASYTLTQAEVGKSIIVKASYSDSFGTVENVSSAASGVVSNINDSPAGAVTISGVLSQGQTLTASNTITDADGVPTSGAGSIHYQWMADGNNITGASSSTFTLTQSQAGKAISVQATYTDLGGTTESLSSTTSAAVLGVYSGAVIDGYVKGSTVFADVNGDLQLNWADKNNNGKFDDGEGEAWAVTDALGGYTFNTSANLAGVNIVSKGGVDVTTQADVGLMLAPTGTGYITPISTVFAYADKATPGGGAALLNALGLSASDLAYDPVAQLQTQGATAGGNAAKVLKAGASLLTMVNAASALAVELGNGAVDATQAAKGVFSQIASMGTGVSDLLSSDGAASQAALKSVLTASLSGCGVDTSNLSSLIDASASSISAVTTSIQKLDATAIAAGDQIGLARLGQETLTQTLTQVAVAVEAGGADASTALSSLSTTYNSNTITQLAAQAKSEITAPLSGIVYDWKTHTLLKDVNVKLVTEGDGVNHLYELRNVHMTANGDVTAELWANLGTKSVQNLDFDLGLDSGVTGVFTADATTMTGFTTTDMNTAGHVGLAAMSTTNSLTGSVKLGALSLDLPTGTTLSSVKFLTGEAGDIYSGQLNLAAYGAKVGALLDMTDIHGAFDYQGLDAGLYSFELDKALTSAETGSQAISSADALAALKMAVGRNPNGDAAGTMAASPYQFIAADVNADGRVSSADALAILKMAVRRSDALPREWLFVREDQDFWNEVTKTFTTTRSSVVWDNEPYDNVSSPATLTQNFVAVLKGDVNASWVAPAGSEKLADSYFIDLVAHNPNSMQLSQWGITTLAV